jgi:hypothetical protein
MINNSQNVDVIRKKKEKFTVLILNELNYIFKKKYFLAFFFVSLSIICHNTLALDQTPQEIFLPYNQHFNLQYNSQSLILKEYSTPLYVEFKSSPRMIQETTYRPDEFSLLHITIKNQNSGEIFLDNGFGSMYGNSIEPKKFVIRGEGPYLIDIYGQRIELDLNIRSSDQGKTTQSIVTSRNPTPSISIVPTKNSAVKVFQKGYLRFQEFFEFSSDRDEIPTGKVPINHTAVLEGNITGNLFPQLNEFEFTIIADNITWISDESSAKGNNSFVHWIVPPDSGYTDQKRKSVSVRTNYPTELDNSLSLKRSVNRDLFYTTGYQINNYTLIFKDIPLGFFWVSIQTQKSELADTTISKGSFFTNAPLSLTTKGQSEGFNDYRDEFYFDSSQIIIEKPYTITFITKIQPTTGNSKPLLYYPEFVIGCSKEVPLKQVSTSEQFNYVAIIPVNELPANFHYASLKTASPQDWYYSTSTQTKIGYESILKIADSRNITSHVFKETETAILKNSRFNPIEAKILFNNSRELFLQGDYDGSIVTALQASDRANDVDSDGIPNEWDLVPTLPNYVIYEILLFIGSIAGILFFIDRHFSKVHPKITIQILHKNIDTREISLSVSIIIDKKIKSMSCIIFLDNNIVEILDSPGNHQIDLHNLKEGQHLMNLSLSVIQKRHGKVQMEETKEIILD